MPGNLTLNDLTIGNAAATLDLNGNTLTIAHAITGSTAATSNIVGGTGQIQVTTANPVTISNVTIKDGHTVLLVGASANVAISNTTFNNNTSGTNAGAITTAGTLSLTNCSFTSNSAATSGGAIYATGGTVTISGTGTINGNSSPSGSFIYTGATAQLVLSGWTGSSTDAETIYVKSDSNGMLVKGTNTLTNFAITLCKDLSFDNAGASSLTLGAGSSFAAGTTGKLSGDANDSLSFTYTVGVNSVLSGTVGSLTVNGGGNAMAMPANLTVYSALALSNGSLSIGANTLSIGGTVTGSITGGNTSTIAFIGTGNTTVLPTIAGGLKNLIMNGSGGTMTLGADLTISNSLTLNAGYLDIANYDLTLDTNATIGGTPSSASFVMTSGTGDFIKNIDSNQSFTFALGNYSSGSYYYTPITITFTQATYGFNSYVSAHLYTVKEPHVTENAYITRYWTINSPSYAITDFKADISATYAASDVVTSEAVLNGMLYVTSENSGWQTLSAVNTGTHTFTATGITKFGNFTAYGHYTPPVSHTTTTTNTVPPQNNDQQRQADAWDNSSNKPPTTYNPPKEVSNSSSLSTVSTMVHQVISTNSFTTGLFSSSLTSSCPGLQNGESGIRLTGSANATGFTGAVTASAGALSTVAMVDDYDYSPMSQWASKYEKHHLFKSNVDKLLDEMLVN